MGDGAHTVTVSGTSNNPTFTTGGNLSCTAGATNTINSGTGVWTVNGNIDLTACTYTATTGNTMRMGGSNATITAGGTAFYNFGANGTTNTVTGTDFSISNQLNVYGSRTLSISSGRTVTMGIASVEIVGGTTSTVSGAGTLTFLPGAGGPGTTLTTLSSIVRFDATTGDIASTTIDVRTYGGLVEIFTSSSTNARTATLASGTYTISGAFNVLANGTQDMTVVGTTGNPAMAITGVLDYTGTGGGTEVIQSGTGTWTVAGDINFTSGTYTATSGNTITMTGTSKTFTSGGNTIHHFTTSGTATVTFATNAVIANGDITVGSGTTLSGAQNVTVNDGDLTGDGTVNFSGGTTTILGTGTLGGSNTPDWTMNGITLTQPASCATSCNNAACIQTTSTGAGAGKMIVTGAITGTSCSYSCGIEETCYNYHGLNAGTKTWDLTYNGLPINNLSFSRGTSTFRYIGAQNMTVAPLNYYKLLLQPASGTPTYTLSGQMIVGNDLTIASTLNLTEGTNPVIVGGLGGTCTVDVGGQTLYDLQTSAGGVDTISLTSDLTLSRYLIVGQYDADTLNITAGKTVTVESAGANGSRGIFGDGTINGGTVKYRDPDELFADLTINSDFVYDSVSANQDIGDRSFGGNLTFENTGTSARVDTMATGTHAVAGNMTVQSTGSGGLTVTGASNNPTVNITGDLSFGAANSKGIATGSGTWTVSGGVNLTNGTFTASTNNTLVMDGASKTLTYTTGQALEYFTSNGSITIGTGNLTISKNLVINSTKSLTSTSGTLSVAGNFANAGTFNANSGTVALTSTGAATLSGNTTFSTLEAKSIGGAKTISFTAGSTTTASTFDIAGDGTYPITLQSTSTTDWHINATTPTVDYTSVSHSYNDATDAICANHSTGDGTTTNWSFSSGTSCGQRLYGTIYTNEGTSAYNCSANNLTVKLVVNGTPTQTAICTSAGGTFNTYAGGTSGQPIIAYIDGETPKAVTVSRYGADATINGFNLYQNEVIVRHEDAGPVTNANLGTYDADNDNDIPYSSNTNNLTVNANTKLYVWANKTFTPGGTVTTTASASSVGLGGDIYIGAGGTLSMGSNALSVGGDYYNDGTYSHSGTQTTTFTATGTGFTIHSNSSPFHNLTFNGSGGDWTETDALAIDNDLAMTNGSLLGSQNISVGGSATGASAITLSGGTFTHAPTTAANFGTTSGSTNWTFSTLTFSNAAASTPTTTLSSGGTGQIHTTSNLNLTNGGTSLIVDATTNDRILNVDGTVTIGTGTTLQASNSAAFYVGNTWTNSGTFTANAGSVTFDAGSTGKSITDGGSDWGSVTFNNASGGWSFADATILAGDITMTAGTLSGTNNITINGGDFSGAGTVTLTGGDTTLNGDGTFSGSSNQWEFYDLSFGLTGTCVDQNHRTTNATGTGTIKITNTITMESCSCGEDCDSIHYLNAANGGISKVWELTLAGTPITGSLHLQNMETEDSTFKFSGQGATTFNGTFHNLELATTSGTSQDYSYSGASIYGNLYINGNTHIVTGTAALHMLGTGTIDANDETFYDFYVDGADNTATVQNTGFTVSHGFQVTSGETLSISSGQTVSHTGVGYILNGTVSGAGTMRFTNTSSGPGTGGTLSTIVRYDASAGNILSSTFDARTSANNYGGDVELYSDSASARTVTMAGATDIAGALKIITGASQSSSLTLDNSSTNPAVAVTGNLSFTKGGSGTPAITSGSGAWTVSGNVNFTDGTYTATTGNTLQMNGAAKAITSTGQTLQNFAVTGGSVSSADAMDVNGTWSLNSGSFTQSATTNMNIAGNFTLENGTTFTNSATSGVVIFDGDLTFNDKNAVKQNMGDVEIGTSPDTTDLASDMAANKLTVRSTDVFNTNGYDLDIGNKGVDISGTFDATDDVETDTTVINTGGDFIINAGSTFTQSDSKLIFDDTSGTDNLITDGTYSLYDLEINDGGNALTVEVEDPLDVDNNLTITGGTLDTVSSENNAITIGGNWTNSDIFTVRTAPVTFDGTTTGHTINPGSSSFYNLTFNGSGGAWSPLTNTVTVTNDLIMTAGTFDTSNGTANVTVNGNVQCLTTCGTINMTSTNTFTQSIAADKNFGTNVAVATNWTFNNLTLTGTSGARTITVNGTGTGQIIVGNNLSLTNSGTSLAVDNNTNDRILDIGNDVSIAANTTLSASSSASFTVGGAWTNSGTFTHNSGTVTFDAASGTKTISPGTSSFGTVTFNNAGGTWRSATNTLTLANNLNVTAGTMDNETNDRILDVGGDVTIGGTGVLQASSTANFTVAGGWTNAGILTANSGTIKFDAPSGTKSINSTGASTASFNNLTFDDNAGSAVFQLDSALDVNGNVLITGGILDTKSGSNWGITIGGNWTNNDTFTANSALVTADGTSQQTFSGTLTGSTGKFFSLTITNASGSDPDASPSVIFSGNLETAGTFAATTANTKLRFNAAGTYTLQNISFNGQAQHTRVYLRSSAGGSAWNLNSAGTRTVKNTDVKDSYACGVAPDIDGTHISNKNNGGNTCWNFQALTFTLSSNSLNLGTLTTGGIATASHTIQTVTSADDGYVTFVYVDGDLRDGSNTINSATGTLSAGTEGYGIGTSDSGQTIAQDTNCGSAPYTVTAMTTSQKAVAGAISGPASEISTVCYQAAIASDTVAGSYSQVVTFVTIGLF
ncbi:MAG: hypothetical protein WCT27_00805 [Patescibacteria group bacterium]